MEQKVDRMLCPDITYSLPITDLSHKRHIIVAGGEPTLTMDTSLSPRVCGLCYSSVSVFYLLWMWVHVYITACPYHHDITEYRQPSEAKLYYEL